MIGRRGVRGRFRSPIYLLSVLCLPVLIVLGLLVAVPTSAPPARAAAVFTGQGFDTCAAPDAGTMQAWLASPYRAIGIYIGGANRACGDGNLSAGWTNAVQAQGWKLAPLYVGLQAPCVDQGGLATIDPGSASAEGAAAADDAAQRAGNFGLGAGTPIYLDMEAYNNGDGGCVATTLAFEDAWTNELHAQGLVAGVYGSSGSTIHDLAASNPNVPDDVWFANWNGSTSVFGDPSFPDSAWPNHQRIHQYQGDTSQSFGGVSLDIDLDSVDGALTGISNPNCQVFSSPATGSHQVCGAILAKYLSLGGAFTLGFPLTDETPTPDGVGRFNHFSNDASIYWTPNLGAWSIHGAIRDHWAAMGWERSVLGYPTTDETTTPDGVGRYNHFSSIDQPWDVDGSIYWTSTLGAFSIHGAIRAHWAAMGWERSVLGYPATDETGTPDGVGRFNHFSSIDQPWDLDGSIYWTSNMGAFSIHGAIRDHWAAMGWERSPLGYPATDEWPTPDGVGRFNHFSSIDQPWAVDGSIYFTNNMGAFSIHGAIRAVWASLGYERSFLGYPATDEWPTPDGVGRFNHFSSIDQPWAVDGSIYFTPNMGAFSIHGAIRAQWATLGYERSFLGYPATDETGTPDGVGRYNHFSSIDQPWDLDGSIYWTPTTGAHEVHGAIREKWAAMGYERSCLGYPTGNETGIPGGRESTFQHGNITYSFSTRFASATCR